MGLFLHFLIRIVSFKDSMVFQVQSSRKYYVLCFVALAVEALFGLQALMSLFVGTLLILVLELGLSNFLGGWLVK